MSQPQRSTPTFVPSIPVRRISNARFSPPQQNSQSPPASPTYLGQPPPPPVPSTSAQTSQTQATDSSGAPNIQPPPQRPAPVPPEYPQVYAPDSLQSHCEVTLLFVVGLRKNLAGFRNLAQSTARVKRHITKTDSALYENFVFVI